jgi:prophage regulatory protein
MELVAPPGLPRLIVRPADIEQVIGLSRPMVFRLERTGDFPRRRRLGARASGWLLDDLRDWLQSRPELSPRAGSRRTSGGPDDIGL